MDSKKNPIVYSNRIDKECSILVPNVSRLIMLHFSVEKGDAQIFFGGVGVEPSLKLYPNIRWNQRVSPIEIPEIFIRRYNSKDFIIWLNMERVGQY